jgi:hypothetical protein
MAESRLDVIYAIALVPTEAAADIGRQGGQLSLEPLPGEGDEVSEIRQAIEFSPKRGPLLFQSPVA